MNEAQMMQIFFEIHNRMPRQGPGDKDSTLKALSMLGPLPLSPKLLDVGCGPGQQTIQLATATGGEVIAVDNHEPYLRELEQLAKSQKIGSQIHCRTGNMFNLGFNPETFDVIWSEGAIYIMGFESGLRQWRPLLVPSGCIAVTEITWLAPDAPSRCTDFWKKEYPDMTDIETNLQTVQNTGFESLGHFTLPESSWWNEYYLPLEKRLARFQQRYEDNSRALAVIDTIVEEIEMYREYSAYYGYVFYMMRKTD